MSDAPTRLPAGAALPALPPRVPKLHHPIGKPLGWLTLKLLGWRYTGGFADAPRQVLIGWPHTSNWDGVLALAASALCGIHVSILVKRSLFRPPVGWILRAFGGIPVERKRPGGLLEEAVERFAKAEKAGEGFVLAIAPEGTRGLGDAWKTGFHRIAVRAGVPISILCFDYGRKEIGIKGTVVPTGDLNADLAAIGELLDGVRGRYPERQTPATAGLASGAALPPARGSVPSVPSADASGGGEQSAQSVAQRRQM